MSKYESGEYQRLVGDMVRREVYYCVSELIGTLVSEGSEREDLWSLVQGPPSYGTHYYRCENCDEEWEHESEPDDNESACPNCTEKAESSDFNPEKWGEIYEHWIVSNHLARKLEKHDETVAEFMGLTIWGRPTTGQAIHLDQVICDIYDEANPQA